MDQAFTKISAVFGVISGAIVGLLGGWDTSLKVLLMFMAMDYLTGVIAAFFKKSGKTEYGGFDSAVGLLGILKKILMLFVVVMAVYLDMLIQQGSVLRSMVIMFFVANEGLSILENMALLGVKFPDKLLNALEKLNGKGSVEDPPNMDDKPDI